MTKVVRPDEGRKVRVLSDLVNIKLTAKESQNAMAVMTIDLPPQSFVPPHSHAVEEEGYFVLAGEMLMHLAGKEVVVSQGDFIHVPAGQMHGYRNPHATACKMLAWTIGGAIDEFFVEMGDKIRDLPQDLAHMPAILERHGVFMPPPEGQ